MSKLLFASKKDIQATYGMFNFQWIHLIGHINPRILELLLQATDNNLEIVGRLRNLNLMVTKASRPRRLYYHVPSRQLSSVTFRLLASLNGDVGAQSPRKKINFEDSPSAL
ncbi:hypothetical protein VTL71DRAFT_15318, partial [Oculimacula yallundae]